MFGKLDDYIHDAWRRVSRWTRVLFLFLVTLVGVMAMNFWREYYWSQPTISLNSTEGHILYYLTSLGLGVLFLILTLLVVLFISALIYHYYRRFGPMIFQQGAVNKANNVRSYDVREIIFGTIVGLPLRKRCQACGQHLYDLHFDSMGTTMLINREFCKACHDQRLQEAAHAV